MALSAPVVVSINGHGASLALRLARALGGEWHARAGAGDKRVNTGQAAASFDDTAEHIRMLFAARRPIIGICSAAILIRVLKDGIHDKWQEAPVLAVSDDGATIVPLLGGHHGGNQLAQDCARITGGYAAITSASDHRLGVSLDMPPPPFVLAEPEAAKPVMAALNEGASCRLISDLPTGLEKVEAIWRDWLKPLAGRLDDEASISLVLTMRPTSSSGQCLVFHPRLAALGVGTARACPPDELGDLINRLLAEGDFSPHIIRGVYSIDLKTDEAAVHQLAAKLDVAARFYPAARLEAETSRLANPSDVVFHETGSHGVAEAAALAASGVEGRLLVPKRKTKRATAALAMASDPFVADDALPRGRVMLVGVGPGRAAWRTPEATAMIRSADELVGYRLYLELLGGAACDKRRTGYELGEEEARCRHALEEAAKGRAIALVCSGDAGIYAMAALVYELLDRHPEKGGVSVAARRVEVVSAPGISALQAAAARSGALLGHDFCAISLSDHLTPWEVIERRVIAAAEGDFVIALYNPVSRRRRSGLALARDILLKHRSDDTPVVLASNLGRDNEQIRHRTLAGLKVDEVDMLTIVLIGSTASRRLAPEMGGAVYTPRGYAKHLDAKQPVISAAKDKAP